MEENKEEVVEETTQQIEETPQENQVEEKTPEIDLSKFESADDPNIIKVDLSKPIKTEENVQSESTDTNEENIIQEKTVEEATDKEEVIEQVAEENTETPILEEVTEEQVEEVQEQVEEAVAEAEATGKPLPENIEKLINFMEDTGGDIQDYVRLNQDYNSLDEMSLLKEYYKQSKPHLNEEEINFLMEDQFSYDEEDDEEKEIKRKKLALKEQVADARAHLDGQKSKYYEDIKMGSKLTNEQQKAIDFFNRYNKNQEENQKLTKLQNETFTNKTNQVFSDKFKGFEYNIGDKRFRFNVKDANEIKETQSDFNNFTRKFLDKNNVIKDAQGYHKSLFTAMNADAIANHFYEQGKADAMKTSVAKAKNVNMNPRQAHGEVESSGFKYKILGDNSSDFKFKIKIKNK